MAFSMKNLKSKLVPILLVLVGLAAGWIWWQSSQSEAESGLVRSNGRIEATEIDIATKLAGRVDDILVDEGDFVRRGELLATMQIQTLEAQLREARAQHRQAMNAVATAEAQVAMRRSDKVSLVAQVRQAEAELEAMRRRYERSRTLAQDGAISAQALDDDLTRTRSTEAAVAAAEAQAASADAAIAAAEAQVVSARSQVEAVEATMERIEAEIADSQLKAPRDGRVQFRVAQPGEVLGAGGRVLNVIDLSDVYMTFFLPTEAAGRVGLGTEVRLVLDAAPEFVIPARVSFIASSAQFTPKTVETADEREKLMFRVKLRIAPSLLKQYESRVKTGVRGVAYVRLSPTATWPADLAVKLPQ